MAGEKIALRVIEEDFEKSSYFGDCLNCLLATAAKRQFGLSDVSEGVNTITLYPDGFLSDREIQYYHRSFSYVDYSNAMKNKKPFTIQLTKIS